MALQESYATKSIPETIREAHKRLYGEDLSYEIEYAFSRKFKPYNANARKWGKRFTFSFSKEWEQVSTEILIGLIQELFSKFKRARMTSNRELYLSFIQNLHLSVSKTQQDERLLGLFNQVNERYFNNALDPANLRWGRETRHKLATYDYHTDTITVSSIYENATDEMLKYLLYHEMLHKHFKFSSGKRSVHHSKAFREREKQFENYETVEKQVQKHARRPWYKRL